MLDAEIRCVPVEDEEGKLCGILRYFDCSNSCCPTIPKASACGPSTPRSPTLPRPARSESIGADIPTEEHEEELILLVGASFEGPWQSASNGPPTRETSASSVICGDRPIVQRCAIDHGARALLVTGGNTVSKEIDNLAIAKGVVLLLCTQDTGERVRPDPLLRHGAARDGAEIRDPAGRRPTPGCASASREATRICSPWWIRHGQVVGVISKSACRFAAHPGLRRV